MVTVLSYALYRTGEHNITLRRKIITTTEHTLCLRKNVTLFIFCDIFVRFHQILLIFGRNIPRKFETST